MKKLTAEHLSSDGGIFCWDNTSDDYHAAGMFKMVVNDPDERSFDLMSGKLQYYGKIALTNAGGVIQISMNGNLSRGFDTGCKKIPNGWREYSISSQRR